MEDFSLAIDYHQPLWIAIAFLFGFLAKSINLPPLVGFLAAGFAIKAWGGESGAFLSEVADLGVTLLLFSIGLKLRVGNLLRPEIWGVATLHMATITLVQGLLVLTLGWWGVAAAAGMDLQTALIIGFALSFSSTVFVVKTLEDSGEMGSRHGQVAVGVLIIQDIVAVVFLAASSGKLPSPWAFMLLGLIPMRFVLQHIMERSGHGELLILFGMVMALGGGSLFEMFGVKADLGALIMGVLLANHQKSAELAKGMFSFKEIFLVGFFLEIGQAGLPSLGDVGVALLLLLLIPLKVMLFFLLFTRFNLRLRNAVLASMSLGNFSEFGLIVTAVAVGSGWLDPQWLIILAIAVSSSFVFSAPFVKRADWFYARFKDSLICFQTASPLSGDESMALRDVKAVVFGMGRVGTSAFDRLYEDYQETIVGIDIDPTRVKGHQQVGRRVVLGDPTDMDFWDRMEADAEKPDIALLAMPSHKTNLTAASFMRDHGYSGHIAAIAHYADEVEELKLAGVDTVFDIFAEVGSGFAEDTAKRINLQANR